AAEFLRFGSIQRNAYSNSPRGLWGHRSGKDAPTLLFAGQLTGVEGYTESAATGILAGINLARLLAGDAPVVPPPTTMLGALYRYVHSADPAHFQPMNANFGLLEPLERPVKDKQKKREQLVERALADMDAFAARVLTPRPPLRHAEGGSEGVKSCRQSPTSPTSSASFTKSGTTPPPRRRRPRATG